MTLEQTFIMLKPDAVERKLMGAILSRIEAKNYTVVQARLMDLDEALVTDHYAHLTDKPFFPELRAFMMSGPVLAMIIQGEDVIKGMRTLMGPTNVFEAPPGTIRGDYASDITRNVIHGSDSPESAQAEIARFFAQA